MTDKMDRIIPLEGLRAYLALWVVVCHVLWTSGYEAVDLIRPLAVIREGRHAVELFVILSGFVITMLLHTMRGTYLQFITRRAFRLFPAFLVLFLLSIPISTVALWDYEHADQYLSHAQGTVRADLVRSWWANLQWHIPLHLMLLHGIVPRAVLPDASGAFLVQAWSISLEWQFYLVAPLLYAWAVSTQAYRRIGLYVACFAVILAARYVLPDVDHGAFLPFHLKFFFLGAVSFLIYHRRSALPLADVAFPVSAFFAFFLFSMGGHAESLIPIGAWALFLGLLLESPASLSSRWLLPLFTNRLARYLGQISYSVYLSHMMVIYVLQWFLLHLWPDISRAQHFGLLLIVTLAVTILCSTFLHYVVEVPGIELGRRISRRQTAKRWAAEPDAADISSLKREAS